MGIHRGFTREVFAKSVGDAWLSRYLSERRDIQSPSEKSTVNSLLELVDESAVQVRAEIHEDFYCMNDLADKGQDLLQHCYRTHNLEFTDDWPHQRVAMQLFLEQPSLFEVVHGRFRMLRLAEGVQIRRLEGIAPQWELEALPAFEESIRNYFHENGKGNAVRVNHYEEHDNLWLLVGRGEFMQSQQVWSGRRAEFQVFRPIREDMIRIQRKPGVIYLRTHRNHAATVDALLSAAGTHILGIPNFDPTKLATNTLDLTPIQTGSFSFSGNAEIVSVNLIEAQLGIQGRSSATVVIKSKDVLSTLEHDIGREELLRHAKLHAVQLLFTIREPRGSRSQQRVELRPPSRSVIPRRGDEAIIEDYLRGQGVLLV